MQCVLLVIQSTNWFYPYSTAVTVKTFGFCRTEPEFGLIFLILNMIIESRFIGPTCVLPSADRWFSRWLQLGHFTGTGWFIQMPVSVKKLWRIWERESFDSIRNSYYSQNKKAKYNHVHISWDILYLGRCIDYIFLLYHTVYWFLGAIMKIIQPHSVMREVIMKRICW